MPTAEHVNLTSIGASGEVVTSNDPDPMCKHTTVLRSSHAAQNGSQWSEWSDGKPNLCGFIEKVIAWHPLCAPRRTSAAISWGSQIGGRHSGISRSGYWPHQLSMCQS